MNNKVYIVYETIHHEIIVEQDYISSIINENDIKYVLLKHGYKNDKSEWCYKILSDKVFYNVNDAYEYTLKLYSYVSF